MTQRILIAGAGANQAPFIQKATEIGLFTVAMDGNPDAHGLALADAAEPGDIAEPDVVTSVAGRWKVDGVFPAAEWAVTAVAHAATRLGLPGVDPETAACMRDKRRMRDALERAGLPNPAFRTVTTVEEAESAAQDIGLPVIVKPGDGNASRGVREVDCVEEISLAFLQARNKSRTGAVLVEEFMAGTEYNVDGLVHEGRYHLGGITGKTPSPAPYHFDLGIYMPPKLDTASEVLISDTVAGALQAVGFHTGATHVEVMMTKDGPRIVEMAGRPGGGRIPTDLIPIVYGMDYAADALRLALGDAPQGSRHFERGAALYWIPTRSGVVTSIEGVEAARNIPGVREVVMKVKPGDTMGHVVDCATRDAVGYVLAEGRTADAAIEAATTARDRIKVTTETALGNDARSSGM